MKGGQIEQTFGSSLCWNVRVESWIENEWCLGYEVRRAKYGRCGDEQADFEDDLYISFQVLLMNWIKHHISATAHGFICFPFVITRC